MYESCGDQNTNNEETEEQETTFLDVLKYQAKLEISNSKTKAKMRLIEEKMNLNPHMQLQGRVGTLKEMNKSGHAPFHARNNSFLYDLTHDAMSSFEAT